MGYKDPPTHARFQGGKSGNPGGRPKGRSLTALLNEMLWLDAETGAKPDAKRKRVKKRTNAQVIVEKLIEIAKGGDRQATKDIFDRVEGKVPDKLHVKTTTASDEAAAMSAAGKRYEQRNGKSGESDPKGAREVSE